MTWCCLYFGKVGAGAHCLFWCGVLMDCPAACCQLLNQALRSNKRIDGLYLYICTSTPEVLAQRQKQRLAEAASTQAKKLAWAKQQVSKSSTAGLFDNVIPNTSLDEVSSCCRGHWHNTACTTQRSAVHAVQVQRLHCCRSASTPCRYSQHWNRHVALHMFHRRCNSGKALEAKALNMLERPVSHSICRRMRP